jgi:chromosome partitioning protein
MNQKGGVGKTTTTLNLGAALAARGKRTLLVDLDPQANLTCGLGLRAQGLEDSVHSLLTENNFDAATIVRETNWPNLYLAPSHIDLSGAELEMVTMIGREARLQKALAPLLGRYDYVLVDCLPSLSLLTVNALVAVSEVLVPLQAHPFALEGLGKLFEVVAMIRDAMNRDLRVSGVLITMFDSRTNVARETVQRLRDDPRLRDHLFGVVIGNNIKIAESQKTGVPVIHFDSQCRGAAAYWALCDEVLEMEKSGRTAAAVGLELHPPGWDRDATEEADENQKSVKIQKFKRKKRSAKNIAKRKRSEAATPASDVTSAKVPPESAPDEMTASDSEDAEEPQTGSPINADAQSVSIAEAPPTENVSPPVPQAAPTTEEITPPPEERNAESPIEIVDATTASDPNAPETAMAETPPFSTIAETAPQAQADQEPPPLEATEVIPGTTKPSDTTAADSPILETTTTSAQPDEALPKATEVRPVSRWLDQDLSAEDVRPRLKLVPGSTPFPLPAVPMESSSTTNVP